MNLAPTLYGMLKAEEIGDKRNVRKVVTTLNTIVDKLHMQQQVEDGNGDITKDVNNVYLPFRVVLAALDDETIASALMTPDEFATLQSITQNATRKAEQLLASGDGAQQFFVMVQRSYYDKFGFHPFRLV